MFVYQLDMVDYLTPVVAQKCVYHYREDGLPLPFRLNPDLENPTLKKNMCRH